MKKYSLTIAIIALMLSSCNQWLEEDRFGYSTGDMFRDEANIIRLVGQAYADLVWLHDHWGYWGIVTLTSDEAVIPTRNPGNHWHDGGYWAQFPTHTWGTDDDSFYNLWQMSISGAIQCNRILQTLALNRDVIPEALFYQYVAELEVLRTFYFFTLFDVFGRIPYTEVFDETTAVPLLSVEETWQRLTETLRRNAPNLPIVNDGNRASLYGRVTQGFAYALLARLYLNAESYGLFVPNAMDSVVSFTDRIINAGSYMIEPDFFTNFAIDNSRSRENIFVIVNNGCTFSGHTRWGPSGMSSHFRIVQNSLHYNHQMVWDMMRDPWNGFAATPELIASYEPGDRRGADPQALGTLATERWGWFVGPVAHADGTIELDEQNEEVIIVPTINSLTNATWNCGARLWKFEVDMQGRWMYMQNDFPIIRYAEVLYMRAEAILRGAAGTIDWGYLAPIRTRAGVEPYNAGTLTLDELLAERGREFAWEMIRRRDLIRFGKYTDANFWGQSASWRGSVATPGQPHRVWFPIPDRVLRRSWIDPATGQHLWTQNPGY